MEKVIGALGEVSLYVMAEEIREVLLESAYKKNVIIEVSGNEKVIQSNPEEPALDYLL